MKHTVEIKNRWTARIQFSAEVEADENASFGFKLGLAVRAAYSSRAVLRDADLSGADLSDAVLRRADLHRADLSRADLSDAVLRDADLSDAVLRRADLRRADLRRADLRRADLRRADLRRADLSDADLRRAVLSGAVLSGVPKIENIDAAILAAIEQSKAAGHVGLNMGDWHTCETTHCRAGWAIHLAGEAGYALEKKVGSSATAGALIYLASTPGERIPNFYASNEEAMMDLRARAAKQTGAAS